MTARREVPDAAARQRAVTDFDSNLVVLAGAGTGKTSLLVERVLNAIASGVVELSGLAAITFTEKAAAEMRLRVAEGLANLLAVSRGERTPDPALPAGRAWSWLTGPAGQEPDSIGLRALAALERMDRARIQTLHAFASELLRDHPIEAGVDPDFRVDTGEQADVLRRELWERFLADELGAGASRSELWHRVLSLYKLNDVEQIAGALCGFAVPPELLDPRAPRPTAHELLGAEALRRVERLDGILARAVGLTPTQAARLPALADALHRFAEEGLAAFLAEVERVGPLRLLLDRSKVQAGKQLAGVDPGEFEDAAEQARDLARQLRKVDEQAPHALVEAVAPLALRFREELVRRGFVGFDGLLVLARDLLRDHPEVRRALKRRYRMLLVDELQDTDPLQYEIVLYLAEHESEAGRDAWTARLRPGALFVVGDPKQSIYRFRGADYAAFRRVVDRIVGPEEPLQLTANFRSVAAVVRPINALFESGTTSVWTASDYQPRYEPIRASRRGDDGEDPCVEVWTVATRDGDHADERRRLEGECVAAAIEGEVGGQAAGYRDFAILFRTFASIRHYLRPLRERGIPFVVDGGKDFLKRPEVSQSLAILKTLAQPADPTALLAYLRSPVGGVSDAELLRYAGTGLPWDWSLAPRLPAFDERRPEFPLVAERLAELVGLHESIRDQPADVAVRRVLARGRLLPLAGATYEGAQRVANLRKFAAAAAGLARDGRMSLEDVILKIQEAGLADFEADSPLADDDADAVRITSIHKMKGLETRRLFLPDLGRADEAPSGPDLAARVERTDDGRQLLALKIGASFDPGWLLHQLEMKRHDDAEETRVLYVALTRARDRVVLVGAPARNTRWYRALSAWGYDRTNPPADGATLLDGLVRHEHVDPDRAGRPRLGAVPDRPLDAVEAFTTVVESVREEAMAPFRPPSALEDEAERNRVAVADDAVPRASSRSREAAKAVGLVLHRALESWDGQDAEALREVAARIAGVVAGEEAVDATRLHAEVREILAAFLESDLARERAGIEVLGREVPLLLPAGEGPAWRGSIDLLYRDGDGDVVVADYKTDRDEEDVVLAERYGGQLGVYAEAVRRALKLDRPPRRELWLLRAGRRLVLRDGPGGAGGAEPPRQLSLW